ncbi:MAG: cyclic 2,3-diphosphoglycerate synthetase [Actinomycetota bacterium]
MRTLALVDGEHYPPVTRWALDIARSQGHEVVAALLMGGAEKLAAGEIPELGVPVRVSGGDRSGALAAAIEDLRPDVVLDLSDEPVLGYRERMEAAAIALVRGVPYLGADFRFDPPPAAPAPAGVPALSVFGTGKRTGKTAIAGEVARVAAHRGLAPIVVAMGRGGPAEPQVAEAGSVTLDTLLALVRDGQHAASDYLEDALTTGVTTIGARRAGGGLAGAPFASNVGAAVALAAERDPGLLILEGSGASLPPVDWDAGILVVPVTCPPEYLRGYLGPYRLLRADLAVVTMAGSPGLGSENGAHLLTHLRGCLGDSRVIVTDLQPTPLADVAGRRAFFATTAPSGVAERQVAHLEATHGVEVIGWSARLADRAGLATDLHDADDYEVLLTELKAAAVDVACAHAVSHEIEVVFVDNRAVVVEGPDDLTGVLARTQDLAIARGGTRTAHGGTA